MNGIVDFGTAVVMIAEIAVEVVDIGHVYMFETFLKQKISFNICY